MQYKYDTTRFSTRMRPVPTKIDKFAWYYTMILAFGTPLLFLTYGWGAGIGLTLSTLMMLLAAYFIEVRSCPKQRVSL